jgi:multidrug resistance efflux pump
MEQAATAAADGASEDVRAAELEAASADLLAARLRVLVARREQTHALLQQVEADIEATRIRAPDNGAIVRRLAQPGMAVDTGTPVLSMWLSEETWVEAWVPEEKLGRLREGGRVQVSFPALPRVRFEGRVTRVGLATDFEMPVDYLPQSREARMRPTPQVGLAIHLDDMPALLRPGMSAVVAIPLDEA